MRVYLVGFMGAGKTTVGRHLARELGWELIDLDSDVEAAAGRPVRDIFAAEGEEGFRRREHAALRATLRRDEVVVATGGGILTRDANVALIRQAGLSVWLRPPLAEVLTRLRRGESGSRPLFRDDEQAAALYRRRVADYERADLTLEVPAGEDPARTALRLRRALEERACAT